MMRNRFFKIVGILISMCMIVSLAGCQRNDDFGKKDGTTVVCTIFPIYDWVCEMTKGCDDVNVVLLAKNGADMHSFQPTVKDFVTIADCDMFIYVGGESEEWIDDCLSQNPNESRAEVNLSDVLEEMLLEENEEGILQGEEEEAEGEVENDEHIWLSIKRSKAAVEAIASVLSTKTTYADTLTENATLYANNLDELDKEYEEFVSSCDNPWIIVADRFPFRYLVSDYGIEYHAAFSGCSAETEASFDTILSLADTLAASDEKVLYITESGDEKLAATVMEQAGKEVEVAVLNSVQAVGQADIDSGSAHYIDYMRSNLEVLKQYMK